MNLFFWVTRYQCDWLNPTVHNTWATEPLLQTNLSSTCTSRWRPFLLAQLEKFKDFLMHDFFQFGHLKSNSSSRDSSPAASSTSFDRSRKISVVSRVFSNLMGRGSVPPELPSRNHSTGALERISFRKVFKKRSV